MTIMYPMTATIRIPMPQSKYGWSAGRSRKQSTERGTAMMMAQALPSAAIRTASSPFPSRQSACAGRTESEVSASGMPRKVPGIHSTNVCVIRAANIAPARASGPRTARRTACTPSRMPASVFACTPGISPLMVPRRTPSSVPSTISIINKKVQENEHKSTEMHTILSYRDDESVMKIAVTRLAGKEESDAARCAVFGHACYSVHPLRSEIQQDVVSAFTGAVEREEFDCIFFTSALPAKILAPLLKKTPRVIAIGPQTAKELEQCGIACETLPSFYSRDFVPYLGDWIKGKQIGIPRADVPNPSLIDAITGAGGIAQEFRCYGLEPTDEPLDLDEADAILFTSAMSFKKAIWTPRPDLLVMAIGDITAEAMMYGGTYPAVVGDGSLEGTLAALNDYLAKDADNTMTTLQETRYRDSQALPCSGTWRGIIVIDKPRGPSSHQVAAWVGKMLGCQVGHAGTLDPQVSGILLVMLGNAVRLAPLLLQHDKEYICLMRLHGDVDRDRIDTVAAEFTGRLYQRPPRKSAVKRAAAHPHHPANWIFSIEGDLSCSGSSAMPGPTSARSATTWDLHSVSGHTCRNCAGPVRVPLTSATCIRSTMCRMPV